MTLPRGLTRRDFFMKLGILFNGIAASILAVPIVRYLLSPVTRERKAGYDSWMPWRRVLPGWLPRFRSS